MNGIMTKITLIIGSVAVFSMIISTYVSIFSEGELIAQRRGTISIDSSCCASSYYCRWKSGKSSSKLQYRRRIAYRTEDKRCYGYL